MSLKHKIVVILFLFIFSLSFMSEYNTLELQAYSPASTNYTVYYSKYDSMLFIPTQMPLHGTYMHMLSLNSTIYMVSSERFISSSFQGSNVHLRDNYAIYYITEGTLKNEEINYTISIRDGMFITVHSSPQLIRVLVNSQGMLKVVWAGYLVTTGSVTGYTYINNSAEVILQYLNGTSVLNITVTVNPNSNVSGHLNTFLMNSQITKIISYLRTSIVTINMPKRYSNIYSLVTLHNNSIGLIERYNVTVSQLNGTLVPAIYWNGSSSVNFNNTIPIVKQPISNRGEIYSHYIGFYGINGSLIGFISTKTFSSYSQKSFIIGGKITSSMIYTSQMIVFINGHKAIRTVSINIMHLNNVYLAIAITVNGSLESTANINFTHTVYISTPGILAKVSVNSTTYYIVAFKNNYTAQVHTIKPLSTLNTTINYNNSKYFAEEVNINSSGYVLFNVTLVHNLARVIVLEKTSSGLMQLNSSDYFIVNNTVNIFTDPYSTYYVIYPTISTSVPTTTSATSSSTTNTSVPLSSTSTTISSKLSYYIIIGIIIAIIIVISIILLRRK